MNLERGIAPRLTSMSSSNFLSSDRPVIVFISENTRNFKRIRIMTKIDKNLSQLRIKSKKKRPSYLSTDESIKRVLFELLKVNPENNRYQAKGWGKKILNYGYQQKDFDDNDQIKGISTRQFKEIKKLLLPIKAIKLIETKYGKYYCITPFGIAYLSHIIDKFGKNEVKGILNFCSLYGSKLTKNELSRLTEGFGIKEINKAFLKACHSIIIEDMEKSIIRVTISYKISNVSIVNLYRFFIIKEQIVYNFYYLNPYWHTEYSSEEDFEQLIAENIINLFHYYLFSELMEKLRLKITQKKKYNTKKLAESFGKKNFDSCKTFNDQLLGATDNQARELMLFNDWIADFKKKVR